MEDFGQFKVQFVRDLVYLELLRAQVRGKGIALYIRSPCIRNIKRENLLPPPRSNLSAEHET